MNIESSFPNQADDLIFYQDLTISDTPVQSEYLDCLHSRRYTEAAALLKNSGLFYYGADLFHLMENRIYSLQKYLLDKGKKNLQIYSPTEPADMTDQKIWIDLEM